MPLGFIDERPKPAFSARCWAKTSFGQRVRLRPQTSYDQGQATSPSQTVVPRNSAQQSDNLSSGRRWRDTSEDSVDGSFASAASEF